MLWTVALSDDTMERKCNGIKGLGEINERLMSNDYDVSLKINLFINVTPYPTGLLVLLIVSPK